MGEILAYDIHSECWIDSRRTEAWVKNCNDPKKLNEYARELNIKRC